mgnify:FL=1
MTEIELVGIDADDTLWQSETFFAEVEEKFTELMSKYSSDTGLEESLSSNEITNLRVFGYGVKSFTLSMIETAHLASGGNIASSDIKQIISWGKELLQHPVILLDGVEEAIRELASNFTVYIVTKGDLLHQRSKIEDSGLDKMVAGFDIFHEKDPESYLDFLIEKNIDPKNFLMAGNSLRSDVLPIVAIGGHAVHIPYELTWDYEKITDGTVPKSGYSVIESIRDLPSFVSELHG